MYTRRADCADGKQPSVTLSSTNFQGDPKAPPGVCRCGPGRFAPAGNTDISGADVVCNGQPYCRVCGGVAKVQAACVANARCTGFTFDMTSQGRCGYLKAGAGKRIKRELWATYAKVAG